MILYKWGLKTGRTKLVFRVAQLSRKTIKKNKEVICIKIKVVINFRGKWGVHDWEEECQWVSGVLARFCYNVHYILLILKILIFCAFLKTHYQKTNPNRRKKKFTAEYVIIKLQIPKTRKFLKQPEGKWIGSPSK